MRGPNPGPRQGPIPKQRLVWCVGSVKCDASRDTRCIPSRTHRSQRGHTRTAVPRLLVARAGEPSCRQCDRDQGCICTMCVQSSRPVTILTFKSICAKSLRRLAEYAAAQAALNSCQLCVSVRLTPHARILGACHVVSTTVHKPRNCGAWHAGAWHAGTQPHARGTRDWRTGKQWYSQRHARPENSRHDLWSSQRQARIGSAG